MYCVKSESEIIIITIVIIIIVIGKTVQFFSKEYGTVSDILGENVNLSIKEQVRWKFSMIIPISATLNYDIHSFQNVSLTKMG